MGQLAVAFGGDLVLADARSTARAPGHHVVAVVQPALLPALLQEGPDHIVVFIGEGEVRAAHLRHAQLAHDLFHRAGQRALRPLHRDDLRWVRHQLFAQLA